MKLTAGGRQIVAARKRKVIKRQLRRLGYTIPEPTMYDLRVLRQMRRAHFNPVYAS